MIGLSSSVTAIAGGQFHSLAVQNGALFVWGRNSSGELGDGTTVAERRTPVPVSVLADGVTAIAGGGEHSLAVRNGEVYSWGRNLEGQLGDGTTTDQPTPTLVSGLSDITDVAAGVNSSFALGADGTLWVWGSNSMGQLGVGDTTARLTPTQVFAPAGYKFTAIDSEVYLGGQHVMATLMPVPEPTNAGVLVGGALLLRRRRAARGSPSTGLEPGPRRTTRGSRVGLLMLRLGSPSPIPRGLP